MNRINSPLIRYYRAPANTMDGQQGILYGEYDGIFAVREFVVCSDNRVTVAPFELTFHESHHPTEPPTIAGIAQISWHEFESLWERFAQARLHELALNHDDRVANADVWYFCMPFPTERKMGEAASDIYAEYAQSVGRRSFEVFADHTLVAPHDVRVPEGSIDEMLRAAREGVDADGDLIDTLLRPMIISHAIFEARWEQNALPRLQMLAT